MKILILLGGKDMENIPFYKKYRPTTLDRYLGDDEYVKSVLTKANERGRKGKVLLFSKGGKSNG